MGLRPLDPAGWIEPDIEWPEYHAHKRHSLETRRDHVLRVLPGSLPAQEELRDLLRYHLLRDHGDAFKREDEALVHVASESVMGAEESPILEAGQWVQDDLCLLEDSPEGYRLTAAFLCSPSYWHLEDKMGKTLDLIHAPVPGYEKSLSNSVNAFFDRLEAENPVWRMNWSVTAHAGLMQRFDPPTPGDVDHDPLWLRVERQTLTRLPETGAICFTIRVHRYALDEVLADSTNAEAFRSAIGTLSPDELAYKSLSAVQHRL